MATASDRRPPYARRVSSSLVRTSVPNSTWSAIGASFFVELVYDASIGIPVLLFAFTQGVFPKPPDFASLKAFDLSFFASNLRFTLFLVTAIGYDTAVIDDVLASLERARSSTPARPGSPVDPAEAGLQSIEGVGSTFTLTLLQRYTSTPEVG